MVDPATGKARPPTVDSFTGGTSRRLVRAERRERRPGDELSRDRAFSRAAVGTEFLSPYPPHTHTHGDPIPTADLAFSRYDTIEDAILTCARKLTYVSLIYRTEPTTEK